MKAGFSFLALFLAPKPSSVDGRWSKWWIQVIVNCESLRLTSQAEMFHILQCQANLFHARGHGYVWMNKNNSTNYITLYYGEELPLYGVSEQHKGSKHISKPTESWFQMKIMLDYKAA